MLDCQIPNSQLDDPNAAISQGDGKEKKKRIGFSEKLEIIRLEKLARGGPDPWLTRKVCY